MSISIVAALAGWLTFAALPAPERADSAVERAETVTAEGWQLWQQQKFADAATKFEEAVKLDPGAANAWNGLGWARFNGGDSEAAVPAFEKAVELEPSHPAALNGLGQVYLSWRKYGTARKFLEKAAPQANAAWFGLARLYMLTGKYDEAEKWIVKAQSVSPSDPVLPRLLAAAQAGELPQDLRSEIEPPGKPRRSDATAESARGWQQFNQGNLRSAEESFRKALAKDPENGAALNGLGFCLLNNGKVAEAKPYFEKCIELDPKAVGAMNGLARCLKAEGKVDEAIEAWKKMAKIAPGPTAATVGLATTYLERGEYDQAIPLFEELVQSMPDNAEFQQGLDAAKKGADKK